MFCPPFVACKWACGGREHLESLQKYFPGLPIAQDVTLDLEIHERSHLLRTSGSTTISVLYSDALSKRSCINTSKMKVAPAC